MNLLIRCSVPIICLLLLTSCGGGSEVQTVEQDPEVLYRSCLSCHGQDLKGRSGPSLENLGSRYNAEDVIHIILHGKGRMPAIKRIKPEEAEILAQWLLEQ